MPLQESILMDLDGTLNDAPAVYGHTLDTFSDLMEGLNFHPVAARRAVLEADHIKSVAGHPPTRERFPNSMVEAYSALCANAGITPHVDILKASYLLGRSAHDTLAPLLPGAEELVKALAARYVLHIYTMGDREVQQRRVTETGMGAYFSTIQVVNTKDEDILRGVLQTLARRGHPRVTWVIGNSPRSDIIPALICGLQAIWVGDPGYSYDDVEMPPNLPYYIRVKRLCDIPALLAHVTKG